MTSFGSSMKLRCVALRSPAMHLLSFYRGENLKCTTLTQLL